MKPVHGGDYWDHDLGTIDFSANINPLGPSKRALKTIEKWKINFYPPPYSPRLRSAVAGGLGVGEDCITLGNGSIEVLRDFCSRFLDKANTALIAGPTFSEYARFASVYGRGARYVLASEDNCFQHRAEDIISSVDVSTKVIFICRPNNPTGSVMAEEDLTRVLEFAQEKDIYLFLDEAFIEFSQSRSLAPMVEKWDKLFVLRSFTKFYALPGLRIGYGVSNPGIIEDLERVKTPWTVNIFAHDAALESIRDKVYFEKTKKLIEKERRFLASEISNLGVKVYPTDANFLLLKYNWNSRDVKTELLKEGLLIRDCSTFNGLDTRFIRVSVRGRKDNLMLVKALEKQVKRGMRKGRECEYYPCHFEGQDCTYCFCPFYPCEDERLGKNIVGKKGTRVWSCKDCRWIHEAETVRKIQTLLGEDDIEELSRERRLEIKEKAMKNI